MDASDTNQADQMPAGPRALRRTAIAFAYLALATVGSQLIGFAALAIVARRTSAGTLGAYSFDLAIGTYVGIAGNYGITYLATRDVAQRQEDRYGLLVEANVLVLLVLVPLSVAMVIVGHLVLADPAERAVVLAVACSVVITALTPDWYLLACRRSGVVAVARFAGQLGYGVLVVALVGGGASAILRFAWFNALGLGVTAAAIIAIIARAWRADRQQATIDRRQIRANLRGRMRASLPFGYSLLVLQLYGNVGVPLLGITVGPHEVGIYTVASRVPLALVTLANAWLAVFFPHGSAAATKAPEELRGDVGRILSVTLVASVTLGCAAPFAARELMPLLFGPHYRAAAAPFAVLSIAYALVLLQATTSNVLLAVGSERLYARLITIVAVTLIAVDIPLCTHFKATGAAIGALGAEVLIVSSTATAARGKLGGLDMDLSLLRWALPMGAGIIAVGLLLSGSHASLLDLFAPVLAGALLVALGLGVARLRAQAGRT